MVNVEFIEGFAMKAQRDATVSRRPAAITQADVARAIRAASKRARPRSKSAARTALADERWWAMQTAKHGDCRDQQRDKIKFRRLSPVGSRAGQAIADTGTARAGQSRQSVSRQFPAVAYIPRGGRSHAGRVHGKIRSSRARSCRGGAF